MVPYVAEGEFSMRMVTRKHLSKSIIFANSDSSLYTKKILKFGVLAEIGHFVFSSFVLNNLIPLVSVFTNPQLIINIVLGTCLVSYPFLLVSYYKKSKKNYNADKIEAVGVIDEVIQDMDIMGLDISKENILKADVQVKSHEEKFLGRQSLQVSEEVLIKLYNRKKKLMVLRECSSMIQEYIDQEPKMDVIVHLLDDEEYDDIYEKQLKK